MLESFLSGKRVCLVGPGAQTEIMKMGPLIDSYDVVARVGNYCQLVPDEVGSRTDVLCENFWFWDKNYKVDHQGLYDEWVRQGVIYVNHIWPHNEGLDKFKDINQGRMKLRIQPDYAVTAVRRIVGSPTKGMCSIYDLLTFNITELLVVGFSFCKGFGYRRDAMDNIYGIPNCDDQYIDPNESAKNLDRWAANLKTADHKFSEELDWYKSIKDPRLRSDEWLERIKCA